MSFSFYIKIIIVCSSTNTLLYLCFLSSVSLTVKSNFSSLQQKNSIFLQASMFEKILCWKTFNFHQNFKKFHFVPCQAWSSG